MLIILILILNLMFSSGFDRCQPYSTYHVESQLIEESLQLNRKGDLSLVQFENRKNLQRCMQSGGRVSCYNEAIGPVDHSTLEKQIVRLENTIGKCLSSFYKDESLRRQIWSLGQSLQSIRESDKLCYLRPRAIRVLNNAIDYYHNLKKEMAFQVESHRSPVDADLAGISREPKLLESYAAYFESILHRTPMKKNKQRCEATARAVIGFFLKTGRIRTDDIEKIHHPEKGFRNLKTQVSEKGRQLILIDCEKLDHVLIIEKSDDHAFRLLQSFVNHYSLEASLAENRIYTRSEILSLIDQLKSLLMEKQWNEEKEMLYHTLFHARPSQLAIDEYAEKGCDLTFVSFPLDRVVKREK